MSRHIMIDCETYGVRPGAAIRSIGAVVFDLEARKLDAVWYWNIEDSSCIDVGLAQDKATREYWERQPAAVRGVFETNKRPIREVLNDVRNLCMDKPVKGIWALGSEFDFPILNDAYDRCRLPTPWKAPQIRDLRTVLDLFNFDARDLPPPAEPRTAGTRASHQTKCLLACLERWMPSTAKPERFGGLFG